MEFAFVIMGLRLPGSSKLEGRRECQSKGLRLETKGEPSVQSEPEGRKN